jgi:hypothetical protein
MDHELLPGLWAMLIRKDASVRNQETYMYSILTLSGVLHFGVETLLMVLTTAH